MRVWFYHTFFSSLRSRLVLLVLLAVVPALGLILYATSVQRQNAATEVQQNLLRLARFAAVNQKQASEGARQVLIALSQLQEVREGDRQGCNELLANLLRQYRAYAGFGVFDTQGNVVCSAPLSQQSLNVSDRSYFKIARDTRDFAIGEYQTGRTTGKATVNFAYPVFNNTGQVQAVVVAALDLTWLNQLAAEADLPLGSVLVVTDREGTVLVRYPNSQQWIGKSFPDASITQAILSQREGTLRAIDFDDVERLYAFTTLGSDSVNRDIHVRIGIPETIAFVEADQLLLQNLVALGLVTLLALIAASAGGDAFVIRKMHSLIKTTQRLRSGDLSARTNLAQESGELGLLARAFNEMAAAIEKREQAIAALNHDLQNRVNELQTLFDVIPIGILISYDLDFKDVKANPAFARILGIPLHGNASSTPPADTPRPTYKIFSNGKELLPEETPLRYAALNGVEVKGAEVKIMRGDGSLFSLFGYAAPLLDEEGKPRGSVGGFLDITELRQTEEALRVSRERFDLVIQAVELGLWYCDLPFSQLNWNDKCKEHFGLLPEDEVTIDIFYDRLHPDDRKRTRVAIEQSIEEQTSFTVDYRTVAPSGQIRWIRAIGRSFYSEVGDPIRFDGITIDITKQKRFEAEREQLLKQLETSLSQLEAVLNSMTDGLIIADRDGNILLMNPAALRIHEYHDLSEACQHLRNYPNTFQLSDLDGRSLSLEEWPLARSLQGETFDNCEVQVCRMDTGTVWVGNYGGTPVRDKNGNVILGLVTMRDVTAQKRSQEELARSLKAEQIARTEAEAANRIKDEFLAVLSHELRTPLNPILGWTKLLRTGTLDTKTAASALETIERNAKLQTQLIEDLLDVSRILQGKLALKVSPVDLSATIKAAIETVRLAAEAKTIEVQTSFAPTVGHVIGDPNRLQQVVWNLLSNAVKFTPAGGRVEVRLENCKFSTMNSELTNSTQFSPSQPHPFHLNPPTSTLQPQPPHTYAQITVTDTGKGIKPDFLPYVFDTFRQADGTITRAFGGLGLGLAIARHIVEMHGGTIQAESPGENQGATFTVRLPLLPPDDQSTQSNVSLPLFATPKASLENAQILLVDDDADTLNVLMATLKQYGMAVTAVASARDALAVLADSVPDVLLCDIAMPEMDGYTLIRYLRTQSSRQIHTIPAIALTAHASEADQQQALAAGFNLHLSKPVQPDDLVMAIAKLIAER